MADRNLASGEAFFHASAAIFRTMLHIFALNAGDIRAQAAFQKKLFEHIMKDLDDAQATPEDRAGAKQLVATIFGAKATRPTN